MQFSLTQAAQLFGKNKTTIHRAMASGRLSYSLSPEGKRLIDMSELIRVYGEPAADAIQNATVQPSPESADATDATDATELLTVMRAMLIEMQGMRRELSEIKEQQMLLPPPQPTPSGSGMDPSDDLSGSGSSSAPNVDDADPHGFRATLRNIFNSKE